jgi:hypothetical protein
MSCAVTAYAVDLDALLEAVGCGDPAVARRVRDAHFRPEDGDRIRALVLFGPRGMPWSDSAWALEALCRAYGAELPAGPMGRLGDARAERLADLDALLTGLGVDFSWAELVATSGPPLALEPKDDWPEVFHLATDRVAALDVAVRAAMDADDEVDLLQATLACARAARAPRAVSEWLQQWLAAWPLFAEVRGEVAHTLFKVHGLTRDGVVPRWRWEALAQQLDNQEPFAGLDWRAASLLEQTTGWLRAASARGCALVGFEY